MIRVFIRRGLFGAVVQGVALDHVKGKTLGEYVSQFVWLMPKSVPFFVALNGKRDQDMDREVVDESELTLVPVTAAGVDLIAVLVYAIVAAAAGTAVSYLMQALAPRPKPQGVSGDRGDSASPTYAWDGIATSYGQGLPVPIAYGRIGLGGQVIYTDVFATTASGTLDDRLRMVLALCEGPVHRIGDRLAEDQPDNLGGTQSGQPSSGPFPDEIRVNGNLLRAPSTTTIVRREVTVFSWGFGLPEVHFVFEVWFPPGTPTVVGRIQVVEILNPPTATRFDAIILEGRCNQGDQLVLNGVGSTFGTIQFASNVTRVNPTPGAGAWLRPGALEQRALPPPFTGSSTTFSPNAQLDDIWSESVFTYEADSVVKGATFTMSFVSGLYQIDGTGAPSPYPVQFDLTWRPVGTDTWRGFFVNNLGFTRRTFGLTGPHTEPYLESFGGTFQRTTDLNPVIGPLEIRVVRVTTKGSTDTVSNCIWRNVAIFGAHTFEYPRTALLGLELSAGSRFSGGLPNVVCRCDAKLVRVWDAGLGWSAYTWDVPNAPFNFNTYPPGQNPAWILLEFLLSPSGLGNYLTEADVDLPAFRRWAAFCDSDPAPLTPWNTPGFACNIAIDVTRPAWEWVIGICAAGRASPTLRNGKISPVYQYRDAHGDAGISVTAKEPVQLLTSGNVESLQMERLPKSQRATAFLFQFLNEDDLYAQDVLPVEDEESLLNDPTSLNQEEWRPETIQADGVTSPAQLYREGKWRHRVQRLTDVVLTFVTGPWALAAEVGDLIEFEHEMLRPFGSDVPSSCMVLIGGVAVSQITVDHQVPAATAVVVRDADGKPQFRTVTSAVVVGSTTQLNLSASVSCAAGAVAVAGLLSKLTKTYEVASITLTKDLKREVRAIQWVPEVYDPIPPSEWLGSGQGPGAQERMLPQQPTQETESDVPRVSLIPTGRNEHEVRWSTPSHRQRGSAIAFARRTGSEEQWRQIAAPTNTGSARFAGLTTGVVYDIAVALQDESGQYPAPDAAQRVQVLAEEFEPRPPARIVDVVAAQSDEGWRLDWPALGPDARSYEVREGPCWASGRISYAGKAPFCTVELPGQVLLLAARNEAGLPSLVTRLNLSKWAPSKLAELGNQIDNSGLNITGTDLEAEWASFTMQIGFQANILWLIQFEVTEWDDLPLMDLPRWEVGSGEAHWWTVHGRPASAGNPGAAWARTVEEATELVGDAGEFFGNLAGGPRGEVGSHTMHEVLSRWIVNSTWTPWQPHRDQYRTADAWEVRIKLRRRSTRYRCELRNILMRAFA